MKSGYMVTAFAATSHALAVRETGCCFHLTNNGGPGKDVDQLGDGQNRIGQSGLPRGQYCINADGGLTDGKGRGCIFTPPTGQWQCDAGAKPTPGVSVGSGGTLSFNQSTNFYACPTGDNGGYNIYNQHLPGQPNCVGISLEADNCKASAPSSEAPAPPASACPAELGQNFEFPHLIIPVDSNNPGQCYGTSYNGSAYGTVSSIFNFDIPLSTKGKTCKLEFLFPEQEQLETSAYTYGGEGSFSCALLQQPATESTTFASAPKVAQDFGTFQMSPGNAYTIASVACPAGEAIGVSLEAVGNSMLNYFQDYNPCPIGLYITTSDAIIDRLALPEE